MTRTCPKCGNKIVRDNAAFCDHCGQALTTQGQTGPEPAFALSGCSHTKKPYIIQFEFQKHPTWEGWVAVNAFEVSPQAAQRGGYGRFQATGTVYTGVPCPFCGAANFYNIHEKLTCWNGAAGPNPCAWCAESHTVSGQMNGFDAMNDV